MLCGGGGVFMCCSHVVNIRKRFSFFFLECLLDRLSLAMFEALRGLRDAVAPESGNVTTTTTTTTTTTITHGDNTTTMEMTKEDFELVSRLALTVLQRSANVDAHVEALPGMNRTRTEQWNQIQLLMEQNQNVGMELEEQYVLAKERRNQIRTLLRERTSEALGLLDDDTVGED